MAPGSNQKLRKEAEAFLVKTRLSPQVVFESDVMGALIRAVADGLGWGLFPKAYLRHESLGRQMVLLGPKEGFWKHRLYLLGPEPSEVPISYEKLFVQALRTEINS